MATAPREGEDQFSISLNVREESLINVLDRISDITGYHLEIQEQWNDIPITTSFANLSLDSALNRVLSGLNHAVIYESDETIKIIIIGEIEVFQSSSNPLPPISRLPPPPPAPIDRRPENDRSNSTKNVDSEDKEEEEAEQKEETSNKKDERSSSDDKSSDESKSDDEKEQAATEPKGESDSEESVPKENN
jgi:hypothetical protein